MKSSAKQALTVKLRPQTKVIVAGESTQRLIDQVDVVAAMADLWAEAPEEDRLAAIRRVAESQAPRHQQAGAA